MSHILKNGRGKHYSALSFVFHKEKKNMVVLQGLLLYARKPHMTVHQSAQLLGASMSTEGTKPKLGQSIKQTLTVRSKAASILRLLIIHMQPA